VREGDDVGSNSRRPHGHIDVMSHLAAVCACLEHDVAVPNLDVAVGNLVTEKRPRRVGHFLEVKHVVGMLVEGGAVPTPEEGLATICVIVGGGGGDDGCHGGVGRLLLSFLLFVVVASSVVVVVVVYVPGRPRSAGSRSGHRRRRRRSGARRRRATGVHALPPPGASRRDGATPCAGARRRQRGPVETSACVFGVGYRIFSDVWIWGRRQN